MIMKKWGACPAAGAQGPLLESVLKRIAGDDQAAYAALTERSMMISADNAHGIHPNYADRHDENHGPVLNKGPVIKINANQRYASNAETTGPLSHAGGAGGGAGAIFCSAHRHGLRQYDWPYNCGWGRRAYSGYRRAHFWYAFHKRARGDCGCS